MCPGTVERFAPVEVFGKQGEFRKGKRRKRNSFQRSASSNETMENRFIQSIIPKSHFLNYLYGLGHMMPLLKFNSVTDQ